MRERMKKKKNMIIGGLLALIFLMSVGYAAFATNLNISGTANTSSWIIKITNIREKTHTGGADTVNTSFTDLSASFSSTLTKPGDSVTYEVTVENMGNIDASLKKVTKTFTQNKYIDVTYSGLLEGQMLYKQGGAGSSAIMEVTVTFKDIEIESLTDTITSNITISLDFAQEGNNVDTTKKYLVEYDTQGGSIVESRYATWDEFNLTSDLNPTKTGYDLEDWFTQPNAAGTRVATSRTFADLVNNDNTKNEVTLYAYWHPKSYIFKYDTQGSTTNIKNTSYPWNFSNVIRSTPSRKGYIFNGWYTAPQGQGLKIKSSTLVSEIVQYIYGRYNDVAGGTSGAEVTLYASWTEKSFTIQYDSVEGTPIDEIQTLNWTDPITLPEEPTREGYTFGGWWTKLSATTGAPTSTAKQVTNGSSLSQVAANDNNNKPVILYAYWIEN